MDGDGDGEDDEGGFFDFGGGADGDEEEEGHGDEVEEDVGDGAVEGAVVPEFGDALGVGGVGFGIDGGEDVAEGVDAGGGELGVGVAPAGDELFEGEIDAPGLVGGSSRGPA